ncbi:hypothetical protein M8J75_011952 [Diaphorina citri]|nr:hypothetical protein M8J75_011952 [Diaphorina citri]
MIVWLPRGSERICLLKWETVMFDCLSSHLCTKAIEIYRTTKSKNFAKDVTDGQFFRHVKIESDFHVPQTTGYERNLPLERILGASRETGQIELLVKWQGCDKLDLVPAKQLNQNNPQEVIEFYERRIIFESKGEKPYALKQEEPSNLSTQQNVQVKPNLTEIKQTQQKKESTRKRKRC